MIDCKSVQDAATMGQLGEQTAASGSPVVAVIPRRARARTSGWWADAGFGVGPASMWARCDSEFIGGRFGADSEGVRVDRREKGGPR